MIWSHKVIWKCYITNACFWNNLFAIFRRGCNSFSLLSDFDFLGIRGKVARWENNLTICIWCPATTKAAGLDCISHKPLHHLTEKTFCPYIEIDPVWLWDSFIWSHIHGSLGRHDRGFVNICRQTGRAGGEVIESKWLWLVLDLHETYTCLSPLVRRVAYKYNIIK